VHLLRGKRKLMRECDVGCQRKICKEASSHWAIRIASVKWKAWRTERAKVQLDRRNLNLGLGGACANAANDAQANAPTIIRVIASCLRCVTILRLIYTRKRFTKRVTPCHTPRVPLSQPR
jgi:hypothetical protein